MTQKPETKKPFNVISFAVRGEKGGRRPGLCVESEADWGGRMTGVAAGGFGDCIQHKQSSPVTSREAAQPPRLYLAVASHRERKKLQGCFTGPSLSTGDWEF